jgi:hypothetical protein
MWLVEAKDVVKVVEEVIEKGRGSNSGGGQGTQCQICSKSNHDALICWYMYHPNPSMQNAP